MKRISKWISVFSAVLCFAMSFSLFGCSETKYTLTLNNRELLAEELDESYRAGDEVRAKVKITPNENTVAYLDGVPLTRSKSTQDDFYTFTFTMPEKAAVLSIETQKGFDAGLLAGFYLTFYKDGNPIEGLNHDLESPEAVADYIYTYYDKEYANIGLTTNEGADVFAEGTHYATNYATNRLQEIELENTLYFTYELLGADAMVDWVYFNEQTGEIRTDGRAIWRLDDIASVSSSFVTQKLSQTLYGESGKEYEATFESYVKINFRYIDYLTGVKILEYDGNHQLIKTIDFEGKERTETYEVSESCEYAVIEEEYTEMYGGGQQGEKHYERTLIDKAPFGGGKTLKYPRGNGLILPVYLSIKWAEESDS